MYVKKREKEIIEKQLKKITNKIRKIIIGDVTSNKVLSSFKYDHYNSIVILSESIIPDLEISTRCLGLPSLQRTSIPS